MWIPKSSDDCFPFIDGASVRYEIGLAYSSFITIIHWSQELVSCIGFWHIFSPLFVSLFHVYTCFIATFIVHFPVTFLWLSLLSGVYVAVPGRYNYGDLIFKWDNELWLCVLRGSEWAVIALEITDLSSGQRGRPVIKQQMSSDNFQTRKRKSDRWSQMVTWYEERLFDWPSVVT
jgi:hypothetical protein